MKPNHSGILEEMLKEFFVFLTKPLIANVSRPEPQMDDGRKWSLVAFRTTHKWVTMQEKRVYWQEYQQMESNVSTWNKSGSIRDFLVIGLYQSMVSNVLLM